MNVMGVCMEKEGVLTMNCKETKENGVGMMEYHLLLQVYSAGVLVSCCSYLIHSLYACVQLSTSRSDIIRFPFVERKKFPN